MLIVFPCQIRFLYWDYILNLKVSKVSQKNFKYEDEFERINFRNVMKLIKI